MTSKPITTEEITTFRAETKGCSNVVHLNNAGAGLMPDIVSEAIKNHINLEASFGGYEAAALEEGNIRGFYEQSARLLNTRSSNIAFTGSATDSYSRALSSIPFKPGDIILTSTDDYISNQIQFLSCQKRFGVQVVRLKNAPVGGIDLKDLEEQLQTLKPVLLSITHIPTNSGLVQPVQEIGAIVRKHRASITNPFWYILDACQSIGQIRLDVSELECDYLTATGRKFLRGPRGTGLLYISDNALTHGLEPLFIDMRGAEWLEKDLYKQVEDARRFEDWEFPYSLVIGASRAIEYCLRIGEDRIWQRIQELSGYMRTRLSEIRGVQVLDRGPQLAGLVTFHVQGSDAVYLKNQLLSRKINVVGSFRKFAVMDFDEKGVNWAVRASPHYYNTMEEIEYFLETVRELVP